VARLPFAGEPWVGIGPVPGQVVTRVVLFHVRSWMNWRLTFSAAGILGASLAPYIATWLAKTYSLQFVGYYLTASASLTFLRLLLIREAKHDLTSSPRW